MIIARTAQVAEEHLAAETPRCPHCRARGLIGKDPQTFDITRNPNPHLAFGRGVHFCLGASLARVEMRVNFDALLDRVGKLTLTGPLEYVRSNKHCGVRHMPVTIDPRRKGQS